MPALKGSAWLTLLEFFTERFGPDALETVLARMTPADAGILRERILPISWVDYGVYTRFLLQADKTLGKGDHTLIRESAVRHAQKDMKGLYRMFIRVATPGFVLNRAAQLWKLIFDSGTLRVVRQTPTSADLELTDFNDVPPQHELDQLPFMEEIARMTGVKNVRGTHPQCLARGDALCQYVITCE